MTTDYLKRGMERLRTQAFPQTATAIQGAGQNIREAYQQGGIPAAAGATVRNTMVPAMGLAHDIYSGARQVTDPVGEAVGTFARTVATGNPTPVRSGQPSAASGARSQADNYSNSPERQAWLNSLGNGRPYVQPAAPSELERNNARIMNPDYDVFGGGAGSGGTPAQARTGRVPGAPEVLRTVGDDGRVIYSGEGQASALGAPVQGADDMMSRLARLRQIGIGDGPRVGLIRSGAADEAQDRSDFFTRAALGVNLLRTPSGGGRRATEARQRAVDAMANFETSRGQQGLERGRQSMTRQEQADRLGQQERQMQQQGQQQAREMSLREMLANPQIAAQQLATEQTGRINALQRRLEASKDPAEREQLTDLLRRLTGKEAPMDFSLARIQIGQDSMGEPVIGQIPFNQRTGQYVMPPGQVKTLPPDVTPEDAMSQARAAISAGAPRDAVNKRLQEMGLEPI